LIEINDGGLIAGPQLCPVFMWRSAPRMFAALAGLVHHCHRAHGAEHNRDKDND
jgi:hypothetical protein